MLTASIYHGTLPLILEGDEITDGPNGSLDALTFEILVSAVGDWRVNLAEAGIVKNRKLFGPAADSFDFHAMFVQDLKVKDRSENKVLVAVNALGLLQEDEKRKTSIACQSGRATLGPQEIKDAALRDAGGNLIKMDLSGWIFNPDSGTLIPRENFPSRIFPDTSTKTANAWSIAVPKISIKSTWFTTSRPDQQAVGLVITPPLEIDPPEFPFGPDQWSGLRKRLNDPSGWVLDQRDIEELFVEIAMPDGPHYVSPPTTTPASRGLWAVSDTITYFAEWEPTT